MKITKMIFLKYEAQAENTGSASSGCRGQSTSCWTPETRYFTWYLQERSDIVTYSAPGEIHCLFFSSALSLPGRWRFYQVTISMHAR